MLCACYCKCSVKKYRQHWEVPYLQDEKIHQHMTHQVCVFHPWHKCTCMNKKVSIFFLLLLSGFRTVCFTLDSRDLLSTVLGILNSCSLSTDHVQCSVKGTPSPRKGATTFYRPIKWNKSYYAFTGFKDPEAELEQAHRAEITIMQVTSKALLVMFLCFLQAFPLFIMGTTFCTPCFASYFLTIIKVDLSALINY